ncbi:MAG: SDR family oxidoreductase [Myxococcota bacterium]
MKLLVLGGSGTLGHMACRVLAGRFDLVATTTSALGEGPGGNDLLRFLPRDACVGSLDATDPVALARVLDRVRPDVVLNAVGLIKQRLSDGPDTMRAIRVNALLPHELAAACDERGARLVHVSTDCVFSGEPAGHATDRRGYREDDRADPTDVYGRTKLLGEVVRPPHLTLRTSFIGRELRTSFGLLEQTIARRGRRMDGYAQAIWSGLTTRALCEVLARVMAEHPTLAGLYHVAAPPLSKLELLRRLDAHLGLGLTIVPTESPRCDRSLDGSRFTAATGIVIPAWEAMLDELAADAPRYEAWRA